MSGQRPAGGGGCVTALFNLRYNQGTMVLRLQTHRRRLRHRVTFDEFMLLVGEKQRADLLDGIIYMASPVSWFHAELAGWLLTALTQFVQERDLGFVVGENVAYRLGEEWAPEPDISFIRKSRRHIVEKGHVNGAPDVAIEIVSPDSIQRDYEIKRLGYEKGGVREYWIIDPDERATLFLVRHRDRFVERPLDGSVFRSDAIAGFELDARWLWQRPLPKTLPIVRRLLAKAAR